MNKCLKFIWLCIWFLFSAAGYAYEVNTHEVLTKKAVELSSIDSTAGFLERFDASLDYKTSQFPNSKGEPSDILSLIRFGAHYEDNLINFARPHVRIAEFRVFNHFYDPQNGGRPLTVGGRVLGRPSPDWALEDRHPVPRWRVQEFSYRDANDYYYQAMTSESKEDRDKYWGLTFQTLGHVIHHVQDMAQPHHTRNDAHSPFNNSARQFFESYVSQKGSHIPMDGYKKVSRNTFNHPRKFWDTGDGKGLAEFSSTNFVGVGTNFRGGAAGNVITVETHPRYRLPSGANVQVLTRNINDPDLLGPVGPNQPLDGVLQFIQTPITDHYRPTSAINKRASTYSLFDYDLESYNFEKRFTLNRFNFDEAIEYQLPRAVAYSASLLNYFFRGHIDLVYDRENRTWRIRNFSSESLDGMFELYIENISYSRTKMNVERLSAPIYLEPNGLSEPISDFKEFAASSQWVNNYFLVFKGRSGEHPDTVIGRQVYPAVVELTYQFPEGTRPPDNDIYGYGWRFALDSRNNSMVMDGYWGDQYCSSPGPNSPEECEDISTIRRFDAGGNSTLVTSSVTYYDIVQNSADSYASSGRYITTTGDIIVDSDLGWQDFKWGHLYYRNEGEHIQAIFAEPNSGSEFTDYKAHFQVEKSVYDTYSLIIGNDGSIYNYEDNALFRLQGSAKIPISFLDAYFPYHVITVGHTGEIYFVSDNVFYIAQPTGEIIERIALSEGSPYWDKASMVPGITQVKLDPSGDIMIGRARIVRLDNKPPRLVESKINWSNLQISLDSNLYRGISSDGMIYGLFEEATYVQQVLEHTYYLGRLYQPK